MKRAFSLVELIFVMVIMAILAGIGMSNFKINSLTNDADFVLTKIKQTRFEAIGYDKSNFNGSYISNSVGCIKLDSSDLSFKNYEIKSLIDSNISTLCFDYLGRPHNGSQDNNKTTIDSLLHSPLQINLTYNQKSKKITVLPISGYSFISCN